MTEIIAVHFKGGGKQYYFAPGELQVQAGDQVVVETARGLELCQCALGNTQVEDEAVVQPLRPVVRLATEEDLRTVEQNREKEKRAFRICEEKIRAHKLDMKLVDVEYSFEGNKILFFFSSEERVDFRALVKDLAGTLHARIELRQIGVRDEAKMLGGLGICGRPFCCSSFLEEFQPVSIKMAKTQSLSLNPTKISGTCGRLMCCLKYEQEAYEELVKTTPKAESFVETPDGAGTVSSVNLLRQQVKVRLDSAPDTPKCYHNCEICVIRNGKGKRPEGYVEPPLSELAKLRRTPEAEEQQSAAPEFPSRFGGQPLSLSGFLEQPERQSAAPAQEPGEQPVPAEGEKSHRCRRHRGGRGKGGEKPAGQQSERQPAGQQPREGQPRPEKRQGEKPAAQTGHPAQQQPQQKEGQGGEKKPRSRRRWRPRRKPGGEGGQPPKAKG